VPRLSHGQQCRVSGEAAGEGEGCVSKRTYRVLFPFCGIGAGALGFIRANARILATDVRFESIGGIDLDAEACKDFERLTGSPALCVDITKLTPGELRSFAGDEAPDAVFSSAPCVGASGLVAEAKAAEQHYQDLNELALVWTRTMLAAWPIGPRVLLYENVPGITRRAAKMLKELRRMLRAAGYVLHEGTHDCGELGGLAQHRKRWLLVARRPDSVPTLLYQPPKKRVRGVGEVLGELPMPGDPAAGPMHRLPRISWLTWVRLALIPAGGDWRDLPAQVALPCSQKADGGKQHNNKFKVHAWDSPSGTVIGATRPGSGAASVGDPRLPPSPNRHTSKYAVTAADEPARTVTGSTDVQTGAPIFADPRVPFAFANSYRVIRWDAAAGTITAGTAPGSGGPVVADPRLHDPARHKREHNDCVYGVVPWIGPAHAVAGKSHPGNGPFAVQDPRIPSPAFGGSLGVVEWQNAVGTIAGESAPSNGRFSVQDPRTESSFHGSYGVAGWTDAAGVVTGSAAPSKGVFALQDPRLGCEPRNGAYGIIRWTQPSGCVTASGQHDNDEASLADPRIPFDWTDAPGDPVPIIIAEDGTWHRPMTTLELGVLQGLPATLGGIPFVLTARTEATRRKHIGNAVPVDTAEAIGRQILITLVHADAGGFVLSAEGGDVWVDPSDDDVREWILDDAPVMQ
jgi:site-specific DNA-cytosine methylase